MKLAPVTKYTEAAALRLRELDKRQEQHSTGLPIAFGGGYGPTARTQAHADVMALVEAVLGRPPTLTEIKGAFGDDAA